MRIFDAHNDYLTVLSKKEARKYYLKLRLSGVNLLSSIYTTELKSPFKKIRTLAKLKRKIHIEDLGILKKCKMGKFAQIKPFSCGLTWNYKNALAGGALSSAGLTKFGKQMVKFLIKHGIKIDMAHLNRKSFWQIAKLNLPRGSVFCSHTAINAVNKHARNLTNKQIDFIVKKGGVIGISFVSEFLNGTSVSTSEDVCNHILYFLRKWGGDNVCIGTDFYGTNQLPVDLKDYNDFKFLKRRLLQKGVSKSDIKKIFYKNLKHFCKQNKAI